MHRHLCLGIIFYDTPKDLKMRRFIKEKIGLKIKKKLKVLEKEIFNNENEITMNKDYSNLDPSNQETECNYYAMSLENEHSGTFERTL